MADNLFDIRRKNLDRVNSASRIHRNCLRFSTDETKEHLIRKLEVCLDLKEDGHNYITEAELVKEKFKVDVFDLDTGTVFEIDNTHKTNALKIDTLQKSGLKVLVIDLKSKSKNELCEKIGHLPTLGTTKCARCWEEIEVKK